MKSLLVSSFNSPSPHKIDNKEHISQNKSNTFKNNRFFNAFELHGLETVKKAWYTVRARNQNVFVSISNGWPFFSLGHFIYKEWLGPCLWIYMVPNVWNWNHSKTDRKRKKGSNFEWGSVRFRAFGFRALRYSKKKFKIAF